MDIRQLEYFLAIVDSGGFNRAATALYVSQPSLSQAVRALEHDLGSEPDIPGHCLQAAASAREKGAFDEPGDRTCRHWRSQALVSGRARRHVRAYARHAHRSPVVAVGLPIPVVRLCRPLGSQHHGSTKGRGRCLKA
ncbi:hypothetical protein SHO565_76490 [Streptomyces sp. HO565]